MNITRDEAAKALSDIAQTEGRSHALYGYRVAGPILMVWGVIWFIGYAAMGALKPEAWGYVWAPADIIGIIATLVMTNRGHGRSKTAGVSTAAWRTVGYMVLAFLFCGGVLSLFHSTNANAYMAFPGLVAGTIYAAVGLARMSRFIWVGGAMIGFTLIGFFLVPTYMAYWMAVTGGGGLIVSGLLVRRA